MQEAQLTLNKDLRTMTIHDANKNYLMYTQLCTRIIENTLVYINQRNKE